LFQGSGTSVADTEDGAGEPDAAPPVEDGPQDFSGALEAYERALEAQQRGDWSAYGEELQRLGEILRTLEIQGE
ncbi:MAG: hypothetical protein Q8Q20_02815, partial [bacterium]|nr:hypothetical protein [bacterium]